MPSRSDELQAFKTIVEQAIHDYSLHPAFIVDVWVGFASPSVTVSFRYPKWGKEWLRRTYNLWRYGWGCDVFKDYRVTVWGPEWSSEE